MPTCRQPGCYMIELCASCVMSEEKAHWRVYPLERVHFIWMYKARILLI